MTTAFVLSGGAALGAVQVGMLQALETAGIRPDLVVGTSVGAINAAWIAGDPTDAHLDDLEALWVSIRRGRCSRPVRQACSASWAADPASSINGICAS